MVSGAVPVAFQSLSGFLVRCNLVSLIGQSSALTLVSIPIGFSGSLQRLRTSDINGVGRKSFNPYRVFWFAATMLSMWIGRSYLAFQSLSGFLVRCNPLDCMEAAPTLKFQSLSGFLVRCNILTDAEITSEIAVSIPIGFSGSLQRIRRSGLRKSLE